MNLNLPDTPNTSKRVLLRGVNAIMVGIEIKFKKRSKYNLKKFQNFFLVETEIYMVSGKLCDDDDDADADADADDHDNDNDNE